MKKKLLGIFVCMLLTATVLSTAKLESTIEIRQSTANATNGILFNQIDFLFENQEQKDSHWGHIEVDIAELFSQYPYEQGYLNIHSNAGWVVQNQFVNEIEGMEVLSMYFNLGVTPGEDVSVLSAYIELAPQPYVYFEPGQHIDYTVGTVEYNAGGLGELPPFIPDYIEEIDFSPAGATYDFTKPNLNENENVQTANDQCAPMGVANSLQYLENSNAHFEVPHDHVLGLRGDDSLVGQLDTAMDRSVRSRSDGDGVSTDQLMEGKFQYLADNGLADSLVHRHQGLPVGDFTHAGITSIDESVDGKVTFDWIEEQLRRCEDIEVGIIWGGGGGHIVRVFGCGSTLGQPFLRYKHDRLQTNSDPTDTRGLEEVQVYVTDLDGDGMMNWGAAGNEIVLALSESVKPIIIVIDPVFLQLAVSIRLINTLDEDLQKVTWSIDVEGLVFLGRHTEGTISLPAGEEEVISSSLIFGLGPATITVTADDAYHTSAKGSCFLFGPFVINLREA